MLCVSVIYCIVFNIVQLPGQQNLFILNVLLCDTGIAVIGVIRGLGIMSKRFVGVADDGEKTWFCDVYQLVARCFWNSAIPVLLLVTVDRFIAIVFPLRHKLWVTPRCSLVLIGLQWTLGIFSTFYLTVLDYYFGNKISRYVDEYHRCLILEYSTVMKVLDIFMGEVSMVTIAILYIVMVIAIAKSGRNIGKMLRTSSVIVLSGFLSSVPAFLFYRLDIRMSYEIAQVFTVTLYYLNCVVDPCVYFYCNPAIKAYLVGLVK